MNNIQISKNFKLREFQCKDGSHQVRLDSKLLGKLQELRDKIGRPLIINSGYRNVGHNKHVGGSVNSQHLLGKAADITVHGMKPKEIASIAEEIGFAGIGIYGTFVHVDVRAGKARWKG